MTKGGGFRPGNRVMVLEGPMKGGGGVVKRTEGSHVHVGFTHPKLPNDVVYKIPAKHLRVTALSFGRVHD